MYVPKFINLDVWNEMDFKDRITALRKCAATPGISSGELNEILKEVRFYDNVLSQIRRLCVA